MFIFIIFSIFDDLFLVFGKLVLFVRYELVFLEIIGIIEVLLVILFIFFIVLDFLKDWVLG